ncbi:Cu-Zn family superoxide dismutase [Sphingomonas naasensis]|uniref:Superoxide dismutase family protein n=1 Tax=Sphingomonas naasensis TaxID=1344951 RepID=A0A4S1WKX5_9SPHN|nr:superoxide dismutase family protein [Sphingomonas naasensis]NIJ21767.1 Cu-Zn family superoxide dismutase [Sphingomonas naasensis]TGX42527.1 superoxide dismutase family protein [Sphingomonas naasensis]
MKSVAMVAVAAAAVLGGCATPEQNARYMAGHFRAQADITNPAGEKIGTAIAEEVDGAIRVMIEAGNLPAGEHGTHIHTVGKCEGPDYASAGGHWNPTTHQHGRENPAGPHAGDMPNLNIGASGRDRTIFTLPGGTFEGLLDQDGAAIVIHANADDYKTDPSGNSGGRIACGVFQAM